MFRHQVSSDEGATDTRLTTAMLIRRGKISGSAGQQVGESSETGASFNLLAGVRNILR